LYLLVLIGVCGVSLGIGLAIIQMLGGMIGLNTRKAERIYTRIWVVIISVLLLAVLIDFYNNGFASLTPFTPRQD